MKALEVLQLVERMNELPKAYQDEIRKYVEYQERRYFLDQNKREQFQIVNEVSK